MNLGEVIEIVEIELPALAPEHDEALAEPAVVEEPVKVGAP